MKAGRGVMRVGRGCNNMDHVDKISYFCSNV